MDAEHDIVKRVQQAVADAAPTGGWPKEQLEDLFAVLPLSYPPAPDAKPEEAALVGRFAGSGGPAPAGSVPSGPMM